MKANHWQPAFRPEVGMSFPCLNPWLKARGETGFSITSRTVGKGRSQKTRKIPRRLVQQTGIGIASDEPVSHIPIATAVFCVSGQDTRSFVVPASGLSRGLHCLQVFGMFQLSHDSEALREVAWSDKEHIASINRCNGVQIAQALLGLDLKNRQQSRIGGSKIFCKIAAETCGPIHLCNSPNTFRLIAHRGDGLVRVVCVVDPGDHNPVSTQIEDAMKTLPLHRLHSNQGGRGGSFQRLQLMKNMRLKPSAMLQVDKSPIEARNPDNFGSQRRSQIQKTTDQCFVVL